MALDVANHLLCNGRTGKHSTNHVVALMQVLRKCVYVKRKYNLCGKTVCKSNFEAKSLNFLNTFNQISDSIQAVFMLQ